MLRNVGAVIAGMLVGSVVNMALILVNFKLFAAPDSMSFSDEAAMVEFIGTLPPHAFILPMVAHLGQAFVGGWIAARLGTDQPMRLALFVGALSMVGGLMNMAQIPHPIWMWIEVPLYIVVAWAAGTLEVRRRAAA